MLVLNPWHDMPPITTPIPDDYEVGLWDLASELAETLTLLGCTVVVTTADGEVL